MPEIQFYAYTKRDDLFSAEVLADKPVNLKLIISLDGVKEGPVKLEIPKGFDSVAITHKELNTCPASAGGDIKCMVDCKRCLLSGQKIIFKKH